MTDLKSLAESRSTILNINPALIQIKPGLNVRQLDAMENREHIDFLKASIRENGFLKGHPLTVFQEKDEVFISDGHCRFTAVSELIAEGVEIQTVPCIAEERGVNEVDRILRQTTSNSGKRLTMLEEATNVARLQSFGLTLTEIARRFGKSAGYVSQLLDFKAAPAEVHQMVKKGEVSSTFAAETLRDHKENGVAILKDAVKTAKAEGATRATKKHSSIHHSKPKFKDLVALVRESREVLHGIPQTDVATSKLITKLIHKLDKALEAFDA